MKKVKHICRSETNHFSIENHIDISSHVTADVKAGIYQFCNNYTYLLSFPNSLLLLNKLESLVCVIATISAYTYTPSFNYPKQTSIDASANMKQTHFLCYLNIFLLGTPHLPLKSSKCKNGYYMAKSPYGIKSKTDKGSL